MDIHWHRQGLKEGRRVTCIEDLDRIEEGNKGRDDSDTTLVRSDVLLIPTPFTVQYCPLAASPTSTLADPEIYVRGMCIQLVLKCQN